MSIIYVPIQNPSGTASPFSSGEPQDTPATRKSAPAPGTQVVYRLVTDADPQFHYTNRVTPIQSRAFDTGISVAIRPQALVLGTVMLSKMTERKIETSFADYHRLNLGDVLDTSNLAEHVMYLLSNFDSTQALEILGLPAEAAQWAQDQWDEFFKLADETTWQNYFDRIIQLMAEGKLGETPARPGGNHDGALVGNGVEYSFTEKELNRQINTYARKLEKVEHELRELERGKMKRWSLTNVEDTRRVLEARKFSYEQHIRELHRQLAQVQKDEVDREKVFGDKTFLLPRALVRIAFGLGMFGKLRDEDGYWAQNAGGVENIVDKKKYLESYLLEQFPEVVLRDGHHEHHEHIETEQGTYAKFHATTAEGAHEHGHPTIEPFAAKLHYNDPNLDLFSSPFEVEHVPLTGEPRRFAENEDGSYRHEVMDMDARTSVHERFEALWKEVRPGEWVCLVDLPFAPDSNSTQHYILLQARQEEDINGNKVFHFLLDNMDNTMEEIRIAFFGGMSRLQCQLLKLFQREMRLRYDSHTLFLHSGHFALSRISKAYWEKFGWEDYFSQEDVVPVEFAGHEHDRNLVDETKKRLFGVPVFFGKRSSNRAGGFHSLVAPSTTDDPNEFMSTEIEYNEQTGRYTAVQRYHKVVDDADAVAIRKKDAAFVAAHPGAMGIQQAMTELEAYIAHLHYQQYAIDGNFLRAVRKLFSSPEHIVAYDAIPIAIGQFRETMLYTEYTLRFLREEFGDGFHLVKLYEQILHQMRHHFEKFMNGDPFAENPFERIGWSEALIRAKKMRPRDADEFLANFNDVFDTPAYDLLQFAQSSIPEDSRAFQFWVLFARKAADNEKDDDGVFLGLGGLSDLPDENRIDLNFTGPSVAKPSTGRFIYTPL